MGQRCFHIPRMDACNLCVPLLVASDVACQRIPEQGQLGIGRSPVLPAWEEDLGGHGHPRLGDAAAAAFLHIGDVSTELDAGGARMARTGGLQLWPVAEQLAVQIGRRLAADGEIGCRLVNNGLSLRRGDLNGEWRHQKGRNQENAWMPQGKTHFNEVREVELVGTLLHSLGKCKTSMVANPEIRRVVVNPTGTQSWKVAHGRSIALHDGVLMAIINVTPDSFSDGGRLQSATDAVSHALACVAEGAHILDIGGESTKPGAEEVSAEEEQARVLPVIEALSLQTNAFISIDTYRASTARLAVEAGAHIINDVHGAQREPEIARVAAELGAGLCLMHTGRGREKLPDVIDDQMLFLKQSLKIAGDAGVPPEAVVLDPGFGFAKDADENIALMVRFAELHRLGYPLLAGTSRKRFIGTMTGEEQADRRDAGTAATTTYLRQKGAAVFRVHNVAINRDALAVGNAILAAEARLSPNRT